MTGWRGATAALAAGLAAILIGGAARAEKIQVGCTATSDCASAMVAVDEGIFRKHGLEVEMTPIALNSTIPAAILSNSIQVGGPTSTVFLQAVDGGLDLVAIAGASTMNKAANDAIAVFVRNGVEIREPKDFVGKKIGAPGLGAFLHVLFRKWLIEKGVDPKGVNFVEVTFPTMNDVLKAGSVDGVLTAEPFIARMTAAGTGTVAVRYAADLARSEPIIFYAASRDWAEKNPDVLKRFREAIAEGAALVNSDRDKAAASISKFTRQPLELIRMMPPSQSNPALSGAQLQWWIDVMKQQDLLQGDIDLKRIVFN